MGVKKLIKLEDTMELINSNLERKRPAINRVSESFSKQDAETWLSEKCKELEIESFELLEDFAHRTTDFSLASEIDFKLQVYYS